MSPVPPAIGARFSSALVPTADPSNRRMNRLRVLLLTETFYPEIGGGERQAQMLSRALVRRGHQVTIVTRRSRASLPREQVDDGVRIIRIAPAGPGRWKKWGLAVTAMPPIVALCGNADVIVVSGYRIMGIPAVAAAKAFGRRCVLKADSRGEMSGEFFRSGLARFHLSPGSALARSFIGSRNALLRKADAFVAISAEIAGELGANGVPSDRVYRVPNGVDTNRFTPASPAERITLRKQLGLPDGPIVVYTGRLVLYKGLPLLLRVWCDLCRSRVAGTLVLVGAGSADMHNCETELREDVRCHGLDDRVIFAGEVENVHQYLRASDAFVFPTENEAFGVSLVEAMACGLPSVATPVGGISDFLIHEQNGLVVESASFPQLRDAIATLIVGGDHIMSIGRAAHMTVLARFSEDAVADGYLHVFESLFDRTTRGRAS